MIPAITVVLVLAISLIVTRIATVALIHTGLSRDTAKFQARSAFTGVGYTTSESEQVVGHPVRRRIVLLLMLLGNAGIVTVVASLVVAFMDLGRNEATFNHALVLFAGIAAVWTAAKSRWLERKLAVIITWMLRRYTNIDVRDFVSLLHLGREFSISELRVEPGYWLTDKTLLELELKTLGMQVLGITRHDGHYIGTPSGREKILAGDHLLLYGRSRVFETMDWTERPVPDEYLDDPADQPGSPV